MGECSQHKQVGIDANKIDRSLTSDHMMACYKCWKRAKSSNI